MSFSMTVFAYLGPETMLPMTSVVAGVVGVAMLFGRNALRFGSRLARRLVAMAGLGRKSKHGARARKIGAGPVGSPVRDRVKG